MYMMRLVYHCKRGKSPEVVECLKILNQLYTLRCGKVVILVFGPCADGRQANGATDLGPQQAAAR